MELIESLVGWDLTSATDAADINYSLAVQEGEKGYNFLLAT